MTVVARITPSLRRSSDSPERVHRLGGTEAHAPKLDNRQPSAQTTQPIFASDKCCQ
jgi:hypothetical protein